MITQWPDFPSSFLPASTLTLDDFPSCPSLPAVPGWPSWPFSPGLPGWPSLPSGTKNVFSSTTSSLLLGSVIVIVTLLPDTPFFSVFSTVIFVSFGFFGSAGVPGSGFSGTFTGLYFIICCFPSLTTSLETSCQYLPSLKVKFSLNLPSSKLGIFLTSTCL